MKSTPPSATLTHTSSNSESVSEAVVTAVADAKGVSTVEVNPPLYDVVDPDALETVITGMSSESDEPAGHVEFSYSGYEITVTDDGRVSVVPEEPSSSKQISR